MRHLSAIVLAPMILVGLASCSRCSGDGAIQEPPGPRLTFNAPDGSVQPTDAAPTVQGDAESPAPSGSGRPAGPTPVTLAQRFVVGWASGRIDSLVALTDGDAAVLVRRAIAGETVDTPLGRLAPDRPRARTYSFSKRGGSLVEEGLHRVTFDLTVRMEEGAPITTHHVVQVRPRDGKIIAWNAPSPSEDGGV